MIIGLKVDVDTERGTRIGVPALLDLFREFHIPATFLFSLGPDNTGKAIQRIFRPGFFQKVSRTSVVSTYGIRTLLNGTLLPAPHIGRIHAEILQQTRDAGHEVGIHCYDHFEWQDHLHLMSLAEVRHEFSRAQEEFHRIFGHYAQTAGAPGWQCTPHSRQVYDEWQLRYSSDTRGLTPFFPILEGQNYQTLELPTTLPTLDEWLGRPEYPDAEIPAQLAALTQQQSTLPATIFTLHAELEGMSRLTMFRDILTHWRNLNATFLPLAEIAAHHAPNPATAPIILQEIDGRSGTLATQGA